MSEACSVCGVDPTTRSGWAAVACRTQEIDGKRYCYACVPVNDDERRRRLADHGISPAQLREKVEALQERANRDADKHNRLCDIVGDHMRRLDAALKRIEELEKQIAAWRGTEKYEPTPEEDARRQRAIEHINAVNERIAAQKAAKP